MKVGNVMANKRTTKNIVRNLLKEHGYYDNEVCIIAEQKSANPRIKKLLPKPFKDETLIKKAIEYNKLLRQQSVPETERNTLISAILIALQDLVFAESFHSHEKNKDLVRELLEACHRVLERNQVSDAHKQTILHEYSGISHNQKLISETIRSKKNEAPNVTLKNLINDLKNSVLPFIKEK